MTNREHRLLKVVCWLRLGHSWRINKVGDERKCKRCGLWQYVWCETADGAKSWTSEWLR
jgi:hypothetical protein